MKQKGYFGWENITVRESTLISAYLATASFYSRPVCGLNRKADNGRRMNGWLDGWLIFLQKKKRACTHIRMIMNKMKAEDNIKNKTSQNTQKIPLTPKQTGIAAKPRDNSEMSENVKVSNSTVLLRYISSFLLFSLLKREVKPETHKGFW